jgi:hypothetical protein
MASASPKSPSWDDLFDLAAGQDGLFSTAQAAERGLVPKAELARLTWPVRAAAGRAS